MMAARVVLVTHVTRFAGPGAVAGLLARGARVIAHDERFADPAEVGAFSARHPTVACIGGVAPDDIATAALAVDGDLAAIVLNDAHPAPRTPIGQTSADTLTASLAALVVRPFALINALAPHLRSRRGSSIVLVTSAAPIRGIAGYAVYCAARGAANSLVKPLALELAPHGIQVNAVAPNFLENEDYYPAAIRSDPTKLAKLTAQIPMGRLGTQEEVGAAIALLAMGEAGFVTGQVLGFSGGWS